eukprot:gene1561-945_t
MSMGSRSRTEIRYEERKKEKINFHKGFGWTNREVKTTFNGFSHISLTTGEEAHSNNNFSLSRSLFYLYPCTHGPYCFFLFSKQIPAGQRQAPSASKRSSNRIGHKNTNKIKPTMKHVNPNPMLTAYEYEVLKRQAFPSSDTEPLDNLQKPSLWKQATNACTRVYYAYVCVHRYTYEEGGQVQSISLDLYEIWYNPKAISGICISCYNYWEPGDTTLHLYIYIQIYINRDQIECRQSE